MLTATRQVYLLEEGLLVAAGLPDPARGVQLRDEAQQALRPVLVLHILPEPSNKGKDEQLGNEKRVTKRATIAKC